MYLSTLLVEQSLAALETMHPFFGTSFLAFKRFGLPVGTSVRLNLSSVFDVVLSEHYRPTQEYDGFYQPFQTSNRAARWVSPRYGSTTLQRITKDTFGDALLHPRPSDWGWRVNYVEVLQKHLGTSRIPTLDLAVWLFRDEDWAANATPNDLLDRLFKKYDISPTEVRAIFDTTIPSHSGQWMQQERPSEYELLSVIGFPPGYVPREGVTLQCLELKEVGPATSFRYEPSDRLNIITGDNSLGKTFVLECIWFALTRQWLEQAILPRRNVPKKVPEIAFELAIGAFALPKKICGYEWDRQRWEVPQDAESLLDTQSLPGVVIYARFDGSFAVFDPARASSGDGASTVAGQRQVFLERRHIWSGLPVDPTAQKVEWICNGLPRDWVSWQTSGARYQEHFSSLQACLRSLSPPESAPIEPGDPMRLPGNSQEIPTIRLPYGDVPVVHASAAVQRIVTLAYVLVWTWHEHLANSEVLRQHPQQRLVLMIDEVEAHLHPRWQRSIVPALMETVKQLWPSVSPQIHLATHSPLVLASAEMEFDPNLDKLHHLRADGSEVLLEELEFVKRGTADAWLMSEVFGLAHARSIPAQQAIENAKKLQFSDTPSTTSVREAQSNLARALAEDDPFWPRWRQFAVDHGVNE